METQLSLYSALLDSLDENEVGNEIDELVQSLSGLVKTLNSEGKTITGKLNNTRTSLDENQVGNEISELVQSFSGLIEMINGKGESITGKLNNTRTSLDENEVGNEIGELVQSFSGLIEMINGKGESITGKLNNTRDSMDSLKSKIRELMENIDPLIATGIYERCKRLKDDIDLFEHQILFKLDGKNQAEASAVSHGLRGKERLNVFLIGEFSAGKTTFTKRLIEDLSGPISGAPETACLVIHKQSASASLAISFKNTITTQESERFEHFLNNYSLRKNFERDVQAKTWTPRDLEQFFVDWDSIKILNFLNEANNFPKAFEKIVWNHRKSGKFKNKNTFLDFADLFDMPGIGGTSDHAMVVENVFKGNIPDVILYLIDTNRGVPSAEESNALKALLELIFKYKQRPLFYWVYQKPSGDASSAVTAAKHSFLDEKRQSLEDYFDELKSGNEKIASFPNEYLEYLQKTSILDARGPKDDTELAQNAASLVLKSCFSIYGEKYVEYTKKLLYIDNQIIPRYEVMTYTPEAYSSGNPFIEKIIAKIKSSPDLSADTIRGIFLKEFSIEQNDNMSDYSYDLKAALTQWKSTIDDLIDKIIDSIRKKKILGKATDVSIDRINTEFWNNYQKSITWQTLLYNVQAYHWLTASYNGSIAMHYINQIGMAILNNIERDIKCLEEVKTSLLLVEDIGKEQ